MITQFSRIWCHLSLNKLTTFYLKHSVLAVLRSTILSSSCFLSPFNVLCKGSVILSKQQLQHRKFNTSYVSSRIDIEKKLSFSLNCRPNFNFLKITSFFVFALFFWPTTKTKLFIRLFFFRDAGRNRMLEYKF